MIASTDARRRFLLTNVNNGKCARQCVARIDAANAAFSRQFESLDYEDERRCVLLSRKNKQDIRAANLTLNSGLAAAKSDLRRQAELPGFLDHIVEYTLRYRLSVAVATKDFTDTIAGIHEEYVRSRARQLVHLALRVARWCAHCQLYVVGASISNYGINTRCAGRHHWVLGRANIQVGLGTYVHVEDKVVYSQGCHARYADDGNANPLGVPVGVRDENPALLVEN